jgi:hypothetical protein
MATTKTTYTGNGTNRLFSFSFPYLFQDNIKVQLNGVNTTAYTFANATTVEMATAPASGVVVTIYRDTNSDSMVAEFYPGSAIRAQDLNDDYSQILYVVQEAETLAAEGEVKTQAAVTAANTATTQANTATTAANAATTTANLAISQSSAAVNTANAATTSASTAVTTANSAVTTANTANNTANQAITAVSNSLAYTLVANVASIPATPANNTYVEVGNSTGIQSFTPLAGLPVGFIGDAGLTVRIYYSTTGSTWNFLNYFSNNPETRYIKTSGGTLTGPLTLSGAPTTNLQPTTKAYVDGFVSSINGDIGSLSTTKLDSATAASTYQTLSGMSSYAALGTAQSFTKAQRGTPIGLTDGATITPDFSLGNNYAVTLAGNRTLANPTNLTAGQSGVITVGQDSSGSRTLAFGSYWKFPGGTAPTLTTTANATDVLCYYVDSSTRITARLVSDVK